ncbi:MAG: FAD-dependent monooxygenase, partial [Chitinophagales bacterium]|nr:FAD-dependent monooxygenase [Hyphomicrobiales bacterium]
MNEDVFDIVIAGGSFVGLTLAIALSKAGQGDVRIAVVDALPREKQLGGDFDGRSAAISASARQMLGVLGVWDAVAADAQAVASIEITDTRLETPVRTALLRFNSMVRDDLAAAYILENVRFRRALFAAAEAAPGVTLIMPASVSSFVVNEKNVSAILCNSRALTAKLLVAADGQKSALRTLAGIKAMRWETSRMGIVTSVGHEAPHEGRAVQHFLPSGPFAMLPLTGNRTSLVWTERADETARLLKLDLDSLATEIENRLGRHLGPLTVLTKPAAYPLSMTLTREFVKPRFVLAGDAAHGLHWIAGQGLNHGLKDVAALAEVMLDAMRLGLDIGDVTVLRRYEQWRRFDSVTSALGAAAINTIFSDGGAPLRMLRSFGLGLVNR